MGAPAKFRYPSKAQIERMIDVAKACGIDVAGFEVSPEGHIRIMEARNVPATPANDFERFQDRL
jgi:predicted DNA-binding transcriptional regulator YafY